MENAEGVVETQEDGMEITFEKRFGWYVVTNRISNGDVTKHTQIYEKNVIEVLNQLVYLIAYDNEQVRLQKKAMGKI
jgi:hypothetical protein